MWKKALLATLTAIQIIVYAGTNDNEHRVFDSREAIAEYAFEAIAGRDAKALLNTLSPDAIRQGIEIFGSRENLEAACQEFLNLAPADSINRMRRNKSQIVRNMSNDRDLVQIDGKWFSNQNWSEISQAHTIARFVDALLDRNTDALWALLSAETQARMNQEANGNQQTLKNNLTDLCKGFVGDKEITTARANRNLVIFRLMGAFSRAGILTEVDGKYFINLLPLMR